MSKKSKGSILGDNPIRDASEDHLGRADLARAFVDQIQSLDLQEGVAVGVLGPWGSGKTSFINLAKPQLENVGLVALDFNPWMFSGSQQLLDYFFAELSAQLQIRPGLAEVGKALEDYGEIFSGMGWVPLVGSWIERGRRISKGLSKILQGKNGGVRAHRKKVEATLRRLDKPLIVVLDDIDRLTTKEIRDIFKLVRLTASFPNIIYILAFDRARVEQALAEDGIAGRDYLEKILQLAVDLPQIPDHVLRAQLLEALDAAVSGVDQVGPFDESRWPDVLMEIIQPLIGNMRDVRRYTAAIHGTVRQLDGQIALVDLLALEAIRVFLPDVFQQLHRSVDGLTTTFNHHGRREDPPHLQSQIDRLLKSAGEDTEIVRDLIKRVFPAGKRRIGGSSYGSDWKASWLRNRQVAHEDILRLYLERAVSQGLVAFIGAEKAWAKLADQKALDTYLRSIDTDKQEEVISSLAMFEEQFTPEHVVPGSVVLLNLLPDLPERQGGMFALNTRMVVGTVVYQLVRLLKNPAAVESAVREILPQLTTLSSKYELITIVGHQEKGGHELVPEQVAGELGRDWRTEVRGTPVDSLLEEPELLNILFLVTEDADDLEPALDFPDSPRFTLALLEAARTEVKSQSVGSRAVRRKPRLRWKMLKQVFGGEEELAARIHELKGALPGSSDELVGLAEKYIEGWRPFGPIEE